MNFSLADVPALNATLNGLAALFLLLGFRAVRRGWIERHRAWMLAAAATSTVFLVSYVAYHLRVGSVRFTGQGPVRSLYFTILLSHTILAVVDRSARAADAVSRPPPARRPPPPDRPMDAADLAVRLGDGRRRLLDALPALPAGCDPIGFSS